MHDLGKGYAKITAKWVGGSPRRRRTVAIAAERRGDVEISRPQAIDDVAPGVPPRYERRQWSSDSPSTWGRPNRCECCSLTCADLAAVGPGVLNSWKGEVLHELYLPPRCGIYRAIHRRCWRTNTGRLRKMLFSGDPHAQWFDRQIEALPSSYLTSTPARTNCRGIASATEPATAK